MVTVLGSIDDDSYVQTRIRQYEASKSDGAVHYFSLIMKRRYSIMKPIRTTQGLQERKRTVSLSLNFKSEFKAFLSQERPVFFHVPWI
jgi:hypothetical protein